MIVPVYGFIAMTRLLILHCMHMVVTNCATVNNIRVDIVCVCVAT